jgi:hypothetical protein
MPVPISSGWLIRLRRIACLELESRYSGKHFSKVSLYRQGTGIGAFKYLLFV